MPLGRKDYYSVTIMLIKDFLCNETDENHYVKIDQIQEFLANYKDFEIHADRKTIMADVRRLEDYYGLDIEHNRRLGYRVENPPFEPQELRLMIDSIQFANFITQKKADDITEKIKALADRYTRITLNRKSHVDYRIQRMNESVVTHADKIHEAIASDLQISFKYSHYMPSIKREKEKRYSFGGKPYIVSPFDLYWSNGYYYLNAYVPYKKEFGPFRVDRMEAITILQTPREGKSEYSSSYLQLQRQAKQFENYKGDVRTVTLRASNSLADSIIDAFGKKKALIPDGKNHFTVKAPVDISPTFFSWLCTFKDKIEIVDPPEIREEMKEYIKSISKVYK